MMMMNNAFMTTSTVLLALVCALVSFPAVVVNGEQTMRQFETTAFFSTDDATTISIDAASSDSNSTSSSSCLSITDIICHDDGNLKALCEAINISELNDDLNEDTWTIFAPTDEAFEALGRDNLDSLVGVFGNDTDTTVVPLTDLLLFHVVPGLALTSDMLPCEAGNNLVEMANGENSRTKCMRNNMGNGDIPSVQRGQFNNKMDPPMIIESDIIACNGVIHILDKVMLYQDLPFEIPDPVPQVPSEEKESEDDVVDVDEDDDHGESDHHHDMIDEDDDDETTSPIIITTVAPTTVVTTMTTGTVAPTEVDVVTVVPTVVVDVTVAPTTVETPAPTVPGSAVVTIGVELHTAAPTVPDDDEVVECQSIVDIACSSVAFSTLCTLLEDNYLLDDLSDGLWTVFAPTNKAFDNAPRFSADTDIEEVLLGHVIANAAIKFEDLVCTEKIEMTNGKNTRTVCQNGKTYQNGRGNDDERRPEIIDINIEACNGVVHVVNQVILP